MSGVWLLESNLTAKVPRFVDGAELVRMSPAISRALRILVPWPAVWLIVAPVGVSLRTLKLTVAPELVGLKTNEIRQLAPGGRMPAGPLLLVAKSCMLEPTKSLCSGNLRLAFSAEIFSRGAGISASPVLEYSSHKTYCRPGLTASGTTRRVSRRGPMPGVIVKTPIRLACPPAGHRAYTSYTPAAVPVRLKCAQRVVGEPAVTLSATRVGEPTWRSSTVMPSVKPRPESVSVASPVLPAERGVTSDKYWLMAFTTI